MISLEQFKKALGTKAETLSHDEVVRLFEVQQKLANILFDKWLESINKAKIDTINATF